MARLVNRESINLQSKKIREVAEALIAAGYLCLDDQATALGLPRSTTWTILHANHKNSGLSASVIKQMLAEPRLPEVVRAKILEYVGQKSSGAYGHNPRRVRRFVSGLVGVLTIADDQNGAFANYRDGPRLANCSGSFASSSGACAATMSRDSSATTSLVSKPAMARRTSSGGNCGSGLDTRPLRLTRDMH